MPESPIQARKKAARCQLKAARAAIPEVERIARSAAIEARILEMEEVQQARAIFIFISYLNEVNTHGLLKYFLNKGKDLAVPKILPSRTMIAVPFRSWDDLKKDAMGILTPSANEPYRGEFDVAITPGLGFTTKGYRIGYGRGYYDKWFATHAVHYKIALAFEAQLVDELPLEETDLPVNAIVTEDRIIRP